MKNPNQTGIIKTIGMAAFTLLLGSLFFTSCSKKKQGCTNAVAPNFNKDAEEDDGSCLLAGRSGATTIVVFPKYNGVSIINTSHYKDTAYVKYNTLVAPGDNPALYDFITVGDFQENYVQITKLKPGNYYIFMTGEDRVTGNRVTGGIGYTLTQSGGEVDLDIPVN